MNDDTGTFRTDIELENPERPGDRRRVEALLVDTGSELTWVPAPILESMGIARVKRLSFRQATGQIVERWAGGARIFAAGTQSLDDVVFAEPGDLGLLGSRTLEGLNVVVDPVSRRLVDAGAMPAAATHDRAIRSSAERHAELERAGLIHRVEAKSGSRAFPFGVRRPGALKRFLVERD